MTSGIVTLAGLFCIWFGLTGRGSRWLGNSIADIVTGKPTSTNAPAKPKNTAT